MRNLGQTQISHFFAKFPAIIKPSIKSKIDEKPIKLNEIGVYKTNTLPRVKPIIE